MKKITTLLLPILSYLRYQSCRHACLLICFLIGCFAGVWGIFCGLATGFLLEKVLFRFFEERSLRKALEDGRYENIKGESFPGAFYVSALAVYCLRDTENAIYQLKTVFGIENDWYVFCRAASSCQSLNGDLLVECLASALRKKIEKEGTHKVPLQNIFRLLGAAEFVWDENLRGEKPSHYLAELLNYSYVSDEIAAAYRVLGLTPGASLEKVREAHRKLAAKFHPDAVSISGSEDNASNTSASNALSTFIRIQTAYETIVHQLS